LLVWLLVLLIAFSLGALLVLYTLYLPERQGLEAMQADLVQANQKVAELESQVSSLSGLDSKNKDLEGALQEANLHVNLLKARADVATALQALAKNDPTRARVALSKTGQTLDAMKGLLDPGQQKTVDDMQSRLKLALGEIGTKAFAAESDLNVLSTSLMELENAYFAAP
jgi:DNA repair ATPase RecN